MVKRTKSRPVNAVTAILLARCRKPGQEPGARSKQGTRPNSADSGITPRLLYFITSGAYIPVGLGLEDIR
jgi:hypothetical protein